jgi:thioredoxin 1
MMQRLVTRSNVLRAPLASSFSSASKVTILSSSEKITEIVSKPGNKVLYFTATWCPPCRAIKPVFEKLSNEYTNVNFVKIDIDENEQTAYDYQITSVPTFVFLAGKQPIAQVSLICFISEWPVLITYFRLVFWRKRGSFTI